MELQNIFAACIFLWLISLSAYSGELEMRNEIENNVKKLFINDDFEELDTIADQYRNPHERTDSGLWKLTIFYSGFDAITTSNLKDEDYWDMLKGKVDKWIKLYPDSPTANIAKGIILTGYAWKIRGRSWARDVPEDAWKPFKENLIIAKEHMLKTKKIAARDPHWYVVAAYILNGLSEDKESFMKLVNEGLEKTPNYYQLYFAAIAYLVPKWHGNKAEIEKFANQSVDRTKSSEGMGMYARIYWYASQTQYDERLFLDSDVLWKKMKQGIYDVLSAYPDSWNVQNFAFFSCLANDRKMTRMLIDKISGPVNMRAWQKPENYEYCRSIAYPDNASPTMQVEQGQRNDENEPQVRVH